MAKLTLRIDPRIVKKIDADIATVIPRKSRNTRIVEILAKAYETPKAKNKPAARKAA